MTRIDAIIFDLDDTLFAERDFVVSGFRAVAGRFADRLGGAEVAEKKMTELFDVGDRTRVFQALLFELGIEDDDLLRDIIDLHRHHLPTIQLHLDADRALCDLGGKFRLGIVTDGRPRTQRAKIEALGLTMRVDAAIVSQELAPWICKPDPRPFEFISTRLQVLGERCVYVADNLAKDFVGPNSLGWRTIQVRRLDGLYLNAVPPTGGEPDAILPDLFCLGDQLAAWGARLGSK